MESIMEFDEYVTFESDAEVGEIKFWCEKYPENIYEIMLDVLRLNGLNSENIKIAMKYGWDINKSYVYPTGSDKEVTPLQSCLEFRKLSCIESLLKNGANLPSDSYYIVAIGNYHGAHEEIDVIIECIYKLKQYGCVFKYDDKFISDDEVFDFWKENCDFLYNFFTKH